MGPFSLGTKSLKPSSVCVYVLVYSGHTLTCMRGANLGVQTRRISHLLARLRTSLSPCLLNIALYRCEPAPARGKRWPGRRSTTTAGWGCSGCARCHHLVGERSWARAVQRWPSGAILGDGAWGCSPLPCRGGRNKKFLPLLYFGKKL